MREWLKHLLAEWEMIPHLEVQFRAMKKMADAPQCERVWSAIERRWHEGDMPLSMEMQVFATTLCASTVAGDFYDEATVSERRAEAKKAIDAIGDLLHCLDRVEGPLGHHSLFIDPLRSMAIASTKAVVDFWAAHKISSEDPWLISYQQKRTEESNDPRCVSFAELVAGATVEVPENVLRALRDGFSAWSAKTPMITHKDSLNVERLRMIRALTSYFRLSYGTPLREQVLAIVSVFFPDSRKLSRSAIAKLAP